MRSSAAALMPYWPAGAKWFVVGGPADENEAQWVRHTYGGGIRCLGVEPNPEYVEYQRTGNNLLLTADPFPGTLIEAALWDVDGAALTLTEPYGGRSKCGSVNRPDDCPDLGGLWRKGLARPVTSRTLDSLSAEHGPFHDTVLWLDIEYGEVPALRGASQMLPHVLLANLEVLDQVVLAEVDGLMAAAGLRRVHAWNQNTDFIYAR